jgi:DNA-binding GntR family transcriptional regulator
MMHRTVDRSTEPDEPSEGGSLPDRVTDWIRAEIVEGRLQPGERIRQEAVAGQLRTSRMPVREALKRLQDEGLVTHISHVGARVASLDIAELDEIYLLREQLEPLALAESIPHLTSEDHDELRRHVLDMESCARPDDPSRWISIDRVFHLKTYSRAGMPRLLDIVEGLWNRTQQYRRAYSRLPTRFAIAHMEHRLLMEAIVGRDPEEATALSRVHIRRTRLALDSETLTDRTGPEAPRQ